MYLCLCVGFCVCVCMCVFVCIHACAKCTRAPCTWSIYQLVSHTFILFLCVDIHTYLFFIFKMYLLTLCVCLVCLLACKCTICMRQLLCRYWESNPSPLVAQVDTLNRQTISSAPRPKTERSVRICFPFGLICQGQVDK